MVRQSSTVSRRSPGIRLLIPLLALSICLNGCRDIAEAEASDSMLLAEKALQQENWQKADELFLEIILLDPTRAEAWIGRGMTQTRLQSPDGAREHYEEALRLYEEQLEEDPNSKHLLRGQVMLLVLLNRKTEAQTIAEAAQSHPDPVFARELLASVEGTARRFPDMILPPKETSEN